MAQPHIQTSFASGEWAPKLQSRVDVQKYHSGAALLRNFYVDYSGGGASTRQGTKLVNFALSPNPRIIRFQPSVSIAYVLEFGNHYIRFHSNGAPILEAATTISSITGLPVTVNSTAHGYANGDWVFISGQYYVVTNALANSYQLNFVYPQNTAVNSLTGTQAQRVYTITSPYAQSDLFPNQGTGNPGIKFVPDVTSLIITHPSYPPQILTLVAPANWTLTGITFGPTVGAPISPVLVPNITGTGWYYAYVITSVDSNGQESASSPPATASNFGDINTVNPSNLVITWAAVPGAVSYNVYKASPAYNAAVPSGSQFGFVSNVLGTSYQESFPGIGADFSQTPPIISSPITGGNVLTINLTGNASYSVVPIVTIPPPSSGFQATAYASLHSTGLSLVNGFDSIISSGPVSPLGLTLLFPSGITATITGVSFVGGTAWSVTNIVQTSGGSLTGAGASVPSNPLTAFQLTGNSSGGAPASGFTLNTPTRPITANVTSWTINALTLIQGGFGYTSPPVPTFSPAGATATTTISSISQSGGSGSATPVGNPRACGFFQERLVLASPNAGLQSFSMSQPAAFFNFNVSNPSQPSDAIFGSIISEDLNDIRSLITVPTGILALTGSGAWLINGGGGISTANPITPSNVSATPQAFNGANDVNPLKINYDALFVTNKGNYVRSASYHVYYNVFVGADVSTLSNHLFFNYQILDWCWAEEPFKVAWAVRSDGNLLSLTYIKEQEVIGWARHDTPLGSFTSTCSVIESNIGGSAEPNTVDAVYFATSRFLADGKLYSIIERMADRYFTYGAEDSWSVDCGLQTSPVVSDTYAVLIGDVTTVGNTIRIVLGGPNGWFTPTMASNNYIFRSQGGIYKITSFTDAFNVHATIVQVPRELAPSPTTTVIVSDYTIWQPVTTVTAPHLASLAVVGVADGVAFSSTANSSGTITFGSPVTKVTMGLAYLPQLQTLPLDLGEPTVQGKRKKISALTLRVADTLGLAAGTSFPNALNMKDFTLGNLNQCQNVIVTNLYSGDGRMIIDQVWQEAGRYCIQQPFPYPATILGAMPEVTVGDTPNARV